MQEMLKPGQWYWVPGGEDRYIGILSGQAELYIVKKKDDTDISRSFCCLSLRDRLCPVVEPERAWAFW